MITLTAIPLSSSRLLPRPSYASADFFINSADARAEVDGALRSLDLVGRMMPASGAAGRDELVSDFDALVDTVCTGAMIARGRLHAGSPGCLDLTDRIRVIRRAWDFALHGDPAPATVMSAAADAERVGGTLSGGL